ncbi:RICIN domain-containing protein [Nibricoccus aquaticus]|uniref:RICIN domain-containing protein n=1 Tax=Nibricoccus aquaticus TaxID=2576891 RepID=UPI001586B2B1|nr:RICIN domain-containing protein [Nibricoccus aquaticus]
MKSIYSFRLDGYLMRATSRIAQIIQGSTQTLKYMGLRAYALGLALLGAVTVSTATAAPVIYTIGDSTVQTYAAGYYPRAGWGQVLQHFFDATKVTVVNKGAGGTSSRSFYNNQWPAVRDSLKAGDYVTIGFGINDSAADVERRTEPFTTFKEFLTKFVNETKAKGAIPIIVATQPRNAWNATTPPTIYPAYHDYPVASRQLAGEIGVPLIDLDKTAITLLQSVGPSYSTSFIYNHYLAGEWPNYPNGNADDVHFQEMGAIELAKLVVQGIRNLSGDANVSKLIPFLKPTYKVTFTSNNSAAGLITRTDNFPAGLTVTAYAKPNAGYAFTGWSGGVTGTKRNVTFVMGAAARTITATFMVDGSTGVIANGTYSLRNVASGKMLDNLGVSSDGATVGQWTDGTSNNQKWVVTRVSGSIYKLSCVTGGKCLDSLGNTANGASVGQWASGSSTNQQWTITVSGSNYKLTSVASGKCLDTGGGTANGSVMQLWTSGNSTNQLWQFVAP